MRKWRTVPSFNIENVVNIGSVTQKPIEILIEVGMAVAMRKGESGALVILKPKKEPWPSNLQGIVYCNYDKSLQRGLEDQAGFRAALRTRILKVAEQRQMLGSQTDEA